MKCSGTPISGPPGLSTVRMRFRQGRWSSVRLATAQSAENAQSRQSQPARESVERTVVVICLMVF